MWSISWLYIVEVVVIVTGNIITIVIFTTTPRLRSRQYALIVNLAVADLLIGLISLPIQLMATESYLRNNSKFLVMYFMQDMFFGTASLFGLAALAIERVHATFSPFKHSSMTNLPYIIGIVLVWVLAFGVGMGSYTINVNLPFYLVFKIVVVTVPLIVITTAYLLIYLNVRCYATQNNNQNNGNNRKLTITLSIVTALSLMTWMPHQYIIAYAAITKDFSRTFMIIRWVSKVFHFGNSLANFFIYAFRMREFKAELIRRFTCRNTQVTPSGDSLQLGSSMRQTGNTRVKASSISNEPN